MHGDVFVLAGKDMHIRAMAAYMATRFGVTVAVAGLDEPAVLHVPNRSNK